MNIDKKGSLFNKYNIRWVIIITISTFILAIIFSIITENSINNLNVFLSFLLLFLIIIIGIIFDIFGIAITKAEETSFHSMATKKINEGKVAIKLIRNAGPISNFCNDVVGDISGIVSGGIGVTIAFRIMENYSIQNATIVNICMTGIIASLTVGGKALGKSIALLYYEKITYGLAKFINMIEKTFGVTFFNNKKIKHNKKTLKNQKVKKQ